MKNNFVSQYNLSIFETSGSPDIVALFFMDVKEVKLLTAKEEIQLASQIEEGNIAKQRLLANNLTHIQKQELVKKIEDGRDAFNLLIIANSRLVVSVAKKYTWTGLSLMDLVQEGHIGLMKAINKYDYRLGYRFSTYAKWWIWQTISRAISSSGRTIRLPPHLTDDILRLANTKSRLSNNLGRYPTPDEICKSMNISSRRLEIILKASQKIQSLDSPISNMNDDELGEYIADNKISLEDEICAIQLKEILEEGISFLNPKESIILRMLYGLDGDEVLTAASVGEKLGLSRGCVRQIHAQAIKSLKEWAITKELEYY